MPLAIDGAARIDHTCSVYLVVGNPRTTQVAVPGSTGDASAIARAVVVRVERARLVAADVAGTALQQALQPIGPAARVGVSTGDQPRDGGDVRRSHGRALENGVALVSAEALARQQGEAGHFEPPVRGGAERGESRGPVVGGVRITGRAASIGARDVELAGSARRGEVDARTVVAEVRELVLFALTGRLVGVALRFADGQIG